MTMFESALLGLCAAALLVCGLVAFWYRPDRRPRTEPVFGLAQVEYEQELRRLEVENFDLRHKLERAHLILDPLREQLTELASERLAVVLQLEVERRRRLRVQHQRDWNRARVRKLNKAIPDNVLAFPSTRAGAA